MPKKYAIVGMHRDENEPDKYWFIDCWTGLDAFASFMRKCECTEDLSLEDAKKLLNKGVRLANSSKNQNYKGDLRLAIINQDTCQVIHYRNIK